MFLQLLLTALQIKMAIMGLPVNQQAVLLPVVDNIIVSIQTEIDKPVDVVVTPATSIATALPVVQQLPVPVFGATLPINNQPTVKKDIHVQVGERWGVERKDMNNEFTRSVEVIYTEDGVPKDGVPVTISTDTGFLTNFMDSRTYVSGIDPAHPEISPSTVTVKTRDYGTGGYRVSLVANPVGEHGAVTATVEGATQTVNF